MGDGKEPDLNEGEIFDMVGARWIDRMPISQSVDRDAEDDDDLGCYKEEIVEEYEEYEELLHDIGIELTRAEL